MTDLNPAQQIAKKRLEEISYSETRIQAKIEAGHPRSKDLKKRLEEYAASRELCEFTLKTGRSVKLKGEESAGGVAIAPPAGEIGLEG